MEGLGAAVEAFIRGVEGQEGDLGRAADSLGVEADALGAAAVGGATRMGPTCPIFSDL